MACRGQALGRRPAVLRRSTKSVPYRRLHRLRLLPDQSPACGEALTKPREIDLPLQVLKANSSTYERLVRKARVLEGHGLRRDELTRLASAAAFAAAFHPGRFADGNIENILLAHGAQLDGSRSQRQADRTRTAPGGTLRRVLHVASHVSGVGGHSRMIHRWISNDQSSSHSLAVLDQRDVTVPRWLVEAVEANGGCATVLPPAWQTEQRASWLRNAAIDSADLVVLHHDGHDVVPVIALASSECAPVATLNHADHQFWLGSSVSDIVINLRSVSVAHTKSRRFVDCNTVLPIPLEQPSLRVMRSEARRMLQIPEDRAVLLSVARAEKFRPSGRYDFVHTVGKILDRHAGAHMYVVGESLAGIRTHLRRAPHERMHFVGSMEDPSVYLTAADVYLEPFPFGTQTALLEAALRGIAVVSAYAPLFSLLVAHDDAVEDLLPTPGSEEEYVSRVGLLLRQPEAKMYLGQELQRRLTLTHVGDGWRDRLTTVYSLTDLLVHQPRPISGTSCFTSEADTALAMWHMAADGRTYTRPRSVEPAVTLCRHSAFVAKCAGDLPRARAFARRALIENPFQRESWRLWVATMLPQSGERLRKLQHKAANCWRRILPVRCQGQLVRADSVQ